MCGGRCVNDHDCANENRIFEPQTVKISGKLSVSDMLRPDTS